MELDRFRWGNLFYDETDEYIIRNKAEELDDINQEYTRQAVSLAEQIVTLQIESSTELSAQHLYKSIEREAENINRYTVFSIKKLRNEIKRNRKEA